MNKFKQQSIRFIITRFNNLELMLAKALQAISSPEGSLSRGWSIAKRRYCRRLRKCSQWRGCRASGVCTFKLGTAIHCLVDGSCLEHYLEEARDLPCSGTAADFPRKLAELDEQPAVGLSLLLSLGADTDSH